VRQKKTAPFLFAQQLCQTVFYADNFLAHRYLNEFPIPCIFHIICRPKNREPS